MNSPTEPPDSPVFLEDEREKRRDQEGVCPECGGSGFEPPEPLDMFTDSLLSDMLDPDSGEVGTADPDQVEDENDERERPKLAWKYAELLVQSSGSGDDDIPF